MITEEEYGAILYDNFIGVLALPDLYSENAVRSVIRRIKDSGNLFEPHEQVVANAYLILLEQTLI